MYESSGFFSPQLHFLDSLLYEEPSFVFKNASRCFEDIKSVIKPVKAVRQLIKALCLLLGIKPKRRGKPQGGVEIDYVKPFHS